MDIDIHSQNYDLCKRYTDLRNIKNQAKHMLDVVPEKLYDNDKNSIIKSLSDYASFMRQAEATYNEMAEYAGRLAFGNN